MNKEINYTLCRVKIVMVNTTEAGNIGATARALKNMCLSQLCLVNPTNFPSVTATARASSASDILKNCVVCQSLAQAVSDCHLVIGASARQRSIQWKQVDVIEACQMIKEVITSNQNLELTNQLQVAVVFGTENSGLTNAELDLCQVLMSIPGNPNYFSLNVAQAVQVFSYQLYIEFTRGNQTPLPNKKPLANMDELAYFYQHLEQVLIDIDYMDKKRPNELLMRRLRKLFHRVSLQKDEVAIFRGILNKISQYKK